MQKCTGVEYLHKRSHKISINDFSHKSIGGVIEKKTVDAAPASWLGFTTFVKFVELSRSNKKYATTDFYGSPRDKIEFKKKM